MGFLTPYYQKVNASRRHQMELVLKQWWSFLHNMGIPQPLETLHTDPTVWEGVTSKLVLHYHQHLLNESHSDATIDRHLMALRLVLKYAQQAGTYFPTEELEQIAEIRGFGGRRGLPIPYPRRDEDSEDRQGGDFLLSAAQAYHLKHAHPDTLRGHRDALLLCLLLDQGLRALDITKLHVHAIDLEHGILRLRHPKTDTHQTLSLSKDTLHALHRYLADRTVPRHGPLFRLLKRDGTAGKGLLIARDIAERVKILGIQILGIAWLTPQRCHAYWTRHHLPPPSNHA